MKRVINFGAGPACLPLPVLEEAQAELLDFAGTGMSILEISHRSKEYDQLHQNAQALLKELLSVDDNYQVLFFGGGASTQFSLVPMNLLSEGKNANYIVTGSWSKKAVAEAKKIGNVHVAKSTAVDGKFTRIPRADECQFSDNMAYVHLTSNNTIFGTQWHDQWNDLHVDAPLVADMSSDLLWRPFDAKRFGLIYAGAQKNLGPAGVTVVLIRQDLLARSQDTLPSMFNYALQAENSSLYNTPPCFAIYFMYKTMCWLKDQGGLAAVEKRNREKAGMIYQAIDAHPDFFRSPVEKESRSMMNVVFNLPNETLEEQFIKGAKAEGIVGIKGHRSVGGMRASVYNSAPIEWSKTLVDFMNQFMKKNG